MTIMMIYILLGILAGAFFPLQATINAKLRMFTKTPLTASLIAFSVGTIVLFCLLLIFNPRFYEFIDISYPTTIFIGGAISGVIFNVVNIVLFAKIGATITTLSTITGQIMTGIVLDHFGLFNLSENHVSTLRIIGGVLMVIAMLIYQSANLKTVSSTNIKTKLWVFLGICVGVFPPLQAVFNGQLRLATESILTATFISFFMGAIILAILVLIVEKRIRIPRRDHDNQKLPLWVYTGGIFGTLIVGGTIVVIHQLGAVLTSLVFIFGQVLMAVILDHFGLFGLVKRRISVQKILALSLMLISLYLV